MTAALVKFLREFSVPGSAGAQAADEIEKLNAEVAAQTAYAGELKAQLQFAVKILGGLPGVGGSAQVEAMRTTLAKNEAPRAHAPARVQEALGADSCPAGERVVESDADRAALARGEIPVHLADPRGASAVPFGQRNTCQHGIKLADQCSTCDEPSAGRR